MLTGSFADLRHVFRLLWKSKAITAITLVALALCIGATAIFSTVYSLMALKAFVDRSGVTMNVGGVN